MVRATAWRVRKSFFVSDLTRILVWVVVIGAAFAILWWQGYLVRFANYIRETREELKKCTWPTWTELKGSTTVVFISIILLGGFTVVVDAVVTFFVTRIK